MKTRIYFLMIMLLGSFSLNAQHDLTLYQMERIPQRISVNPAFIPETGYVGTPFFSEVKFTYAQPFRYNQVFDKQPDDSLLFQPETFLNVMDKNNRFHNDIGFAIFDFGTFIAKRKFFLHFSLKEKVTEDISLPANFFNMLWYGNASANFFGKTTEFSAAMDGSAYDEWSAGIAGKFLDNKLSVGVTLKYLSGRFNVNTKKADFTFYTAPEFYDILVSSDVEVQTSGIDDFDAYMNQQFGSLVFSGNNGFAADLGAVYQLNDKISLNASVIDLGFINWNSFTTTYKSKEPGGQFVYSGMKIGDFVDMFADFSSFGEKIADSIIDLAEIDSIPGEKYTAGIPVKYNLGGSYRINERSTANLLLHGMSCNGHFYPALSASYTLSCSKAIALNVNYSIYNRQFTNLGLGLTINAGGFQMYLLTDNVPGMVFYRNTNSYSFQFGFNMLLGRNKTTEAKTE